MIIPAQSQIRNIQNQRLVSKSITSPPYAVAGNSGLNMIRLLEQPNNAKSFSITSTGHPGTYIYTQVGSRPTQAGQYQVDWNSDIVYVYAFAADDTFTVSYYGWGSVRNAMDQKLSYMAGLLRLDYAGSPGPGELMGVRYSDLDNLEEDQVTTNIADITKITVFCDRKPTDAALGIRMEAINAGGSVETYLEIASVLAQNVQWAVYAASSGNYLLRLSQSHPYWRVYCLSSSTLSMATGIHIVPSMVAIP